VAYVQLTGVNAKRNICVHGTQVLCSWLIYPFIVIIKVIWFVLKYIVSIMGGYCKWLLGCITCTTVFGALFLASGFFRLGTAALLAAFGELNIRGLQYGYELQKEHNVNVDQGVWDLLTHNYSEPV